MNGILNIKGFKIIIAIINNGKISLSTPFNNEPKILKVIPPLLDRFKIFFIEGHEFSKYLFEKYFTK
jgi:hypothetical protein